MSSEVIDAFREIQDRVISMVLINEELYKCEKPEVIDFFHNTLKSSLIFFRIIGLINTNLSLSMNMENHFFFDMDTVKPRK